jgi:transposase-like protein
MAKRKIRDERDARRCLAAAKEAGLTRAEWARQHGVDGRSLYAWARNLKRDDRKTGHRQKHKGLVELIPEARHARSRYVIRCGQLAVEVDEQFDEAILARLLRVIAAC